MSPIRSRCPAAESLPLGQASISLMEAPQAGRLRVLEFRGSLTRSRSKMKNRHGECFRKALSSSGILTVCSNRTGPIGPGRCL